MDKTKLQQELKEKIKEGIKPSQLKKQRTISIPTPPASPVIAPVDKKPSQKQDKEGNSPSPIVASKKIQELEKDVNFWKSTASNHLSSLQKLTAENDSLKLELQELKNKPTQLNKEVATALKEANQKIRDQEQTISDLDYLLKTGKNSEIISKLQAKIKELNKTIQGLQNQGKIKENNKQTLFTCSHCQQEWSTEFIRLIDKSGNKTCADCLEQMTQQASQETGKEITIEAEPQEKPEPIKLCQFCSKPYPQSQLKPRHIKNLPNKDPREITLLCQECLTYRAIKADYYCPLTSEGRDTYEGNEFDCYCPHQ